MLPTGNTARHIVRSVEPLVARTADSLTLGRVTGRSAVVTTAVVETAVGLVLAAAGAVIAAQALGARSTVGTDR
jgi:hypothetical protein